VLGHHVGITDRAVLDASGDAGGGSVLVGGDERAANPAVRNAAGTWFGPDAAINVDALRKGDGGRVVLWSAEATRAYGKLTARGGEAGGDGGTIATSGKYLDVAGATVDPRAWTGTAGRWRLEASEITISSTGPNPAVSSTSDRSAPSFASVGASGWMNGCCPLASPGKTTWRRVCHRRSGDASPAEDARGRRWLLSCTYLRLRHRVMLYKRTA
jgi:hypothetical protein